MSQCSNCSSLQAEVRRLETEIQKLQRKVKKLESEIDRLRNLIYSVCQWCYQVAQDAAAKLKQHQARGTWAYHKGRREVASAVFNALRGG